MNVTGDMYQALLTDIIATHGKIVTSLCHRMIQKKEIAEEAAQEVWLEVFKRIAAFRGEAKLSTWIYTIAYRVILNYAKKERRYSTQFLHQFISNKSEPAAVAAHSMEEELFVKETCDQCLTGILHCLDNETRLLYLFRDAAGLSYPEIAVIFRKNEAAVRQIISRARRKIKNFLNRECILFNDNGKCRCQMKQKVEKLNLAEEYQKLRTIYYRINIYKQFEKVIPPKNYWEKYGMSQKSARAN